MTVRARFTAAVAVIERAGVEFTERPERSDRPSPASAPCSAPTKYRNGAPPPREPGRDAAWIEPGSPRAFGWKDSRPVIYEPARASDADDLAILDSTPADDVCIRIGSADGTDAGVVRVSRIVADAFVAQGFEVRWDETAARSPRVIF